MKALRKGRWESQGEELTDSSQEVPGANPPVPIIVPPMLVVSVGGDGICAEVVLFKIAQSCCFAVSI